MLSEKDCATLQDMLHHINLAERFAADRTFESLRDDLMPLYAVTRCLEIISEASRRLSEQLKLRHPQIPWREMAALAWKTLREDLPLLRAVIESESRDEA